MKILIALLFINILVSSYSSAQERWRVSSATDSQTGEFFVCSGVFEFSKDQVLFIQKNGLVKYDFKITAVTDHPEESTVEYQIIFRGAEGVIRIKNKSQEATLTLEINRGSDRILPYQFSIQSIS